MFFSDLCLVSSPSERPFVLTVLKYVQSRIIDHCLYISNTMKSFFPMITKITLMTQGWRVESSRPQSLNCKHMLFFLQNLYQYTKAWPWANGARYIKMDWIDCLVLVFPLPYNIMSKTSIIKGAGGLKLLVMKTFRRDQIDLRLKEVKQGQT